MRAESDGSQTGVRRWRAGVRRADCPAEVPAEFRNDMCWRWQLLESNPVTRIRPLPAGGSARRPRPPDLREKALISGRDSAPGDWAGRHQGIGATLGEHVLQGH